MVSLQPSLPLEGKLLVAGFVDVQTFETKAFLPLEGYQSFTVRDNILCLYALSFAHCLTQLFFFFFHAA